MPALGSDANTSSQGAHGDLHRSHEPRRRAGLAALAAVLVLVTLAALGVLFRPHGGSASLGDLHGVRLGMTVRDVRSRFDVAGAGTWSSEVGDDMVLEWKPGPDARGVPLFARFEFHMGIVMAMRADLPACDPAASGPDFELSDTTVVVRERSATTASHPDSVHLTVIARSCPTHAKEAERIVQSHGRK